MKSLISEAGHFILTHAWIYQVIAVVIITIIASRVRHFVLNRIESRLKSIDLVWSRSTIRAIRKPAALLIWIVGILYSIEILRVEFEITVLDALPSIRNVAIITVLVWFVYRFIGVYETNYLQAKSQSESPVDVTSVQIATKILRVITVVLGVLVVMQTLGLNIAGILAFGGIGGIAIGFAAREMISNYFGALMIFMDRPFKVGETITSSDRDIEGTVIEIGWRQTVIQRFDSRTLYVPNSVFSTVVVRNLTHQTNRRIYEYVGIRYDDAKQLTKIVEDTRDMLSNHPDIDQDNLLIVNFDRFAASSLDFFIYCFTRTVVWAEYHEVKQDVLVKTMDIIEKHGAQIAFPTSTIHLIGDHDESGPPAASNNSD